MSPTLSIVTINFNDKAGLARTYSSISQILDTGIEHLTIDGGSSDGSVELMNEFIKKHHQAKGSSEPDQGIYNAMNKGWRSASGKYIAYINSGDEVTPESYRKFIEFISSSDSDVFYAKTIIRSADGENSYIYEAHPNDLLKHSLPHPSCAVRKQAIQQIQGFDERYRICADREMLVKLWHRGASFKFFPHETTIFYEGGASSPRATRAEDLEINIRYRHISRPKYLIKRAILLAQEKLRSTQNKIGGL